MGIGWRILWDKKIRTLLSACGIAMAVIIIFIEQGFYYGIVDAQSQVAYLIRGDLVVMHNRRTHLSKWQSMRKIHLFQTRAHENITSVTPVYKMTMGLLNQETDQVRRIVVFAFPADSIPLDIGDPETLSELLKIPQSVLFDRKSRDIYGKVEKGQYIEVNGKPYKVAGYVDIGPNIVNDGAIVMSEGTLLSVAAGRDPIMGVIKIDRRENLEKVRQHIEGLLPDTDVMTPAELAAREQRVTTKSVPVGIIFSIGMVAGFIIGVIVCYQVLFNEINDQIRQYATLKAIGFRNSFLVRIILEQSVVLSIMGFVLSLPVTFYIGFLISAETSLPMKIDAGRILLVLSITIAMCISSGLIAMRRVWNTDPAELY